MFAPPVANGKNRPTTLASSQFSGSGKYSLLNACLFFLFREKCPITLAIFVHFMSLKWCLFYFYSSWGVWASC